MFETTLALHTHEKDTDTENDDSADICPFITLTSKMKRLTC